MEILKDKYSITELSERLNVTDHALRYYEKEFNLHIPKDARGRRYYTAENANIMFQIKNMRDEGLEIKAIKKILLSENLINDPPPVVMDDGSTALVPIDSKPGNTEIRQFLENFTNQLTACVSAEVGSAKDHLTREINKSKLELGACMENSIRKLETKLEKHFNEVDKSLGEWRERSKKGFLKRLLRKTFR